jgi:hypothetical protein
MASAQPTDRIFSDQLFVFPIPCASFFVTLQSRIHEPWARLLSSSLEDRLRYAASDCFETFPFPNADPRTVIPALEIVGRAFYRARAKYMLDTEQGLTKTYNHLKDVAWDDPRILDLRRLTEAMDRGVLDAYGWNDVVVPPYCALTDAGTQATQTFNDDVIDHLYVLNAERAREEARLGPGLKKAAGSKKTKHRKLSA